MADEYDNLIGGQSQSDNDYDDLLSVEVDKQNDSLRTSMFDATKKNPDQQSKVIKLAEKTGLPNDTIERNIIEVENKTKFEANDYDELLKSNPVLSSHLSDHDFASVAHDDVDNLSWWEEKVYPTDLISGLYGGMGASLRGLADINTAFARSVERGLRSLSPSVDSAMDSIYKQIETEGSAVNKINSLAHVVNPFTMSRDVGEAFKIVGDFSAPPAERSNLVSDITVGVGQLTGQILVGAINPSAGLSMLFGQGASQQADRADLKNATPEEKDKAVFIGSAITGITEKIGIDKMLDRLPPKIKNNIVRQLVDIGIAGGVEAVQETVEGILQNMTAIGIYDEGENPFEGIEREALAAGGTGAVFRAIINAAIPGRMSGAEYKQQQSQQGVSNKGYIDSIGKSAKESELSKRSKKKYQKFIADALQNSGVETVGIPADRLNVFFQENPDAFDDFNDNVELFESKFAEASALGEDITIPTDVLATYMGGKEYYESLSQDIRLDDSSMTAYEAELFNAEAQEQLLQDYQVFADEIEVTEEGRVSGDAVYDDVVQQLIDTGQAKEIAEKNALVTKVFFESMSELSGVDAFSLYKGRNIRIRGEKTTDELDTIIDQLRTGKVPTEVQARGESLTDFLREKGGLIDEGGELSARDLGITDRFKKNLIQAEGMSLDVAIESAREAGYIPEADPNVPDDFTANDLLNLIDSEIAGQPVYSEQFADQDVLASREQLNALSDELQRAGLDINQMTNLEVKDFINQVIGTQFDQPVIPTIIDGIEVEEITDEQAQQDIFKQYFEDFAEVRPGAESTEETLNTTVSGRSPEQGWYGATSVTRGDKPARIYRGASVELSETHFDFESLGKATDHPSSGLGVFFSESQEVAAGYGTVTEFYLDIRNPFIIKVEDLQGFDSLEDAHEFRESLKEKGHDGIILDARHLEGVTTFVAFEPDQVIIDDKDVELFQEEEITIESREFKNWFGDSKVVDEAGDPLVVYHGTETEFEAFDPEKAIGGQHWFTTDKAAIEAGEVGAAGKGVIIDAYLSIQNPAGWNEYENLTLDELISRGYDGLALPDSDGETTYVAFEPTQIKSPEAKRFDPDDPRILFQDEPVPRGTKKRGRIIFTDDSTIIDLFKDANLSTFLHESGHLFLNAFSEISQQPNAPEQMTTDMQSILDWLDVDSIAALDPANNGDAAITAQEKWARGFEAYLREGKSPSNKLRRAFQSFKSWLTNIYKSAKNLNVELTDEIRGVMDRMLATDEEIKSAQDRNNIKSVFESAEQSGLTEEQTAKVNLANVQAIEASKEKLLVKLLKEITREKKQWWKDEKLKTRKEVESEYHQRKDYKAKTWLQSAVLPDGSDLGIDHIKLSRTDLVSMYGDKADSLWRKLPFGKNSVWVGQGGVHPDVVAGMFGFRSGDEMVKAIINAGNMKTEINKETERRMLDKHGDILNDGTIEAEADDAMHNINSTESMLSDINALNKKTGRGVSPKQVFKNIAKQIINEKRTVDIKPRSILQNERRITDRLLKAVEAGDNELSLQLANQRLINHYMYMEARDARTRVDTIQRYMTGITRRKYNPKAVDPDYINQLKLLASMYDFRKGNNKEVRKAQTNIIRLVEWLSAQKENENAVYTPELISPDLARVSAIIDNAKENGQPVSDIVDQVVVKSYKDMTLGDLEDIYNTARHLRFIGGKNSDDARAELREQVQGIADSIFDKAGKDVEVVTDKDWLDKTKEISLRFSFDQIKLLSDIRLFDGFEDFGPMFNNIYQHVVDGTNKRIKIDLDASERIKDIFMPMSKQLAPKNDTRTFKKTDGTGSWSLSTRQRVMLAIYWGSPESREAILEGHKVVEADVQKMLDTMTDEQLDFVEQIWEFNESFWPELSKIETSINGVPPVKVDHVPFTANNRELAGGYFRLYYEWSVKDKFKIDMHDEAGKMMHSNRVTQSKTGAVISRVGSGGRQVKLDPDSFFRAVEDNLQFIAFAEASREVARIVQHPVVSSAIVQKYGKDRYQSFVDSLDGVFAGDVATSNSINIMLRGVRTNLTFGYLALSVRNFVQQPIALTNAMGRIGEGETLKAVKDLFIHPKQWSEFIQEKSVYMQQRNKFVNREAAEQLASIKGNAGIGFKPKWAFVLQTLGDAFATYPTWLAAYRQGVAKFNKPGTDPDVLEKMAVTYADELTASTVGSGLSKDLAPLFQGSGSLARGVGTETVKQLTFMGSFFNMTYNLYYDAWKRLDTGSPKSSLNFVREMAWYAVIPGMLGALVVGDDPDDDEAIWEWAIKSTAEFGFSSSMFWRNMVSTLKGFEPNIPALSVFTGAARIGKIAVDVAEGDRELDAETAAKLIRGIEPMVALPGGGQAARTLEYLDSYNQGDEGEFSLHGMLIEGKER